MKLEFSKLNIQEVIDTIDENKALEWQLDIRKFLEKYAEEDAVISISELQGEVIFDVEMRKQNIKNTVIALNELLELKQGDTTLLSNSIRMKSGAIVMAQAIEAKMDIYCTEQTDVIKIPYTGQDQNTIHWGLNYVYLTEAQVHQSSDVLHRIEKIVVEAYGIKDETKSHLYKNDEQHIYEVFSVKSFPIGIRKLGEEQFTTFGEVQISRSAQGHMLVNSPNYNDQIDTQKVVHIVDNKTFRWLLPNEYLDNELNTIIDFDHIEDVLRPYIDSRFVVINYPHSETGKEVVTLVVKRLYIDDFKFPTDGLKDYEIPRQNYSIGDFPENDDRAVIRSEVRRLLAEN
ncbi:MAG: hypothetical protein KBS93_03060 [Flavobacteriaceae bacterium]|nr:hypothetical protein [Candidatus Onthonaster equi]